MPAKPPKNPKKEAVDGRSRISKEERARRREFMREVVHKRRDEEHINDPDKMLRGYRKAAKLRRKEKTPEEIEKRVEENVDSILSSGLSASAKIQRETMQRIKDLRRAFKDTAHRRESVSRILAQRSLLHFIERLQPGYIAGWVHKLICTELEEFSEAVARGEDPRLMLFMPPRHGKSLIASQMFPAWHLGKHPEHEFIVAAYSQSLPVKFSRKTREVVRDPSYKAVFPGFRMHPEIQSAEEWATAQGGAYITAGVGGGITGKGAHILVIDDPVKNREDAESETVRQVAKDWFTSTAYTRLAPGGGVLVIMTRWHHDDLAGWLLEQRRKGEITDNWKVIEFPAAAMEDEYLALDNRLVYGGELGIMDDVEKTKFLMTASLLRRQGEPLHPERYDHTALERIRRAVGRRDWTALYQQQPTPDEGDYIERPWFRYKTPHSFAGMTHFISADLAIGKKQSNDYTCYGVWAMDHEENLYLRAVVRRRMATFEAVETLLDLCEQYEPALVGIENGGLKLAMMDQLNLRMRQRRIFPSFDDTLTPISDKAVRGRTFQGMLQAGVIYYPEDRPGWLDVVENEALQFPNGKFDDTFDMQAWAARMSKNVSPPKRLGKAKTKSWKEKLGKFVAGHSPRGSHMSS